ncbi:hypothetical protein ACIBJI_40165 [Nocardia sp. NPDC050408]|uniref:hypothetical protein n=1 Tax=Nocardia sp. NPDC050408 TaxID=3364319 RepID=UPI0037962D1D
MSTPGLGARLLHGIDDDITVYEPKDPGDALQDLIEARDQEATTEATTKLPVLAAADADAWVTALLEFLTALDAGALGTCLETVRRGISAATNLQVALEDMENADTEDTAFDIDEFRRQASEQLAAVVDRFAAMAATGRADLQQ